MYYNINFKNFKEIIEKVSIFKYTFIGDANGN